MSFTIKYAEWGWQEYCSFCSSLWGDYTPKLMAIISEIYPNSEVVLLNSARTGLSLIFNRLIELFPEKKEVIIPEYICPSVTDTLSHLGLKIVFARVDDDLNISPVSIEELINHNTLAIVAVHMYGNPAAVQKIQKICDLNDIILIDDAAQLGAEIPGHKNLGAYGDFGLISFAQSKTIVTGVRGSGGVLLINKEKWRGSFSNVVSGFRPAKSRRNQFLYFLGAYQFENFFHKLVYYFERLKFKLKIPNEDYYPLASISNLDAAIAYYQYASVQKRIRLKCQVLEIYKQQLEDCDFLRLPQIKKGQYLTRLFVELDLCEVNYHELRSMLSNNGIRTRKGYPYSKKLLELPLSSKMKMSDVETITLELKKCIRCLKASQLC